MFPIKKIVLAFSIAISPTLFAAEADRAAELLLIVSGINSGEVDLTDRFGHTALHVAAKINRGDIIQRLLHNKADVDAQDWVGQTPLFFAARNESTAALKSLIAHNANVNFQSSRGFTPLHAAALAGSSQAVKSLLAAKANHSLKNRYGQTAENFACMVLGYGLSEPSFARFAETAALLQDARNKPEAEQQYEAEYKEAEYKEE